MYQEQSHGLYLRNLVQSRFPCRNPSQVKGQREGEAFPSQHTECALSFPVSLYFLSPDQG